MAGKDRHNPLWGLTPEIDPAGGRRLSGREFRVEGEGGMKLSREADSSGDWKLVEGDSSVFTTEIEAAGDLVKILTWRPFLLQEYSRGFGNLVRVHLSVVDLVNVAGLSRILSAGDLTKITEMRELNQDFAISLTFVEGEPSLMISDRKGKEVNTMLVPEGLRAPEIGFVRGKPEYTYESDFDFLTGKVGLEIYPDRIVYYYVGRVGLRDKELKTNVLTIKRQINGVAKLDREVTQGMPDNTTLIGFMDEVLPAVNK